MINPFARIAELEEQLRQAVYDRDIFETGFDNLLQLGQELVIWKQNAIKRFPELNS